MIRQKGSDYLPPPSPPQASWPAREPGKPPPQHGSSGQSLGELRFCRNSFRGREGTGLNIPPNDPMVSDLRRKSFSTAVWSSDSTVGRRLAGAFARLSGCPDSDDEGQTWQRNEDGELFVILGYGGSNHGAPEPTVCEVQSAKLLMMVRTRLGRLFQAWSYNDGQSWTRLQPTLLAASPAPAQIRKLPNGHLLCVFTQHSRSRVEYWSITPASPENASHNLDAESAHLLLWPKDKGRDCEGDSC